jgi:hypothetical protein
MRRASPVDFGHTIQRPHAVSTAWADSGMAKRIENNGRETTQNIIHIIKHASRGCKMEAVIVPNCYVTMLFK